MQIYIAKIIPTQTQNVCAYRYIYIYVYIITAFYLVFKRCIKFRHLSVFVTRVLSKCLRPRYTKINSWAVQKSGLGVFRFNPK